MIKGRWLRRELHHTNKNIFKLNSELLFSRKTLVCPQMCMITVHFSPKVFSLGLPPSVSRFFSYSLSLLPPVPQIPVWFLQRSLAFSSVVLAPATAWPPSITFLLSSLSRIVLKQDVFFLKRNSCHLLRKSIYFSTTHLLKNMFPVYTGWSCVEGHNKWQRWSVNPDLLFPSIISNIGLLKTDYSRGNEGISTTITWKIIMLTRKNICESHSSFLLVNQIPVLLEQ